MQSSKLINYSTNKWQGDQGNHNLSHQTLAKTAVKLALRRGNCNLARHGWKGIRFLT